jgi:hypothetical protein
VLDLEDVFNYGVETFGLRQAENYENEIMKYGIWLKDSQIVIAFFQNASIYQPSQRCIAGLFLNHI